jgi:hypothetical protein
MMYIFDMNGGKQGGVSLLVTMSNDKRTLSEAAKAGAHAGVLALGF